MTSDFLRPVGALLACLTASCLPIPNKVRDTPPLQGSLTLDGVPLANTALRVEPVKGDFSVPPIPCGISGRLAVSDSAGAFNAPPLRHWEPWVSLVGESPDWNRHWRICIYAAQPGDSTQWQLLWDGHTNLGTPLRLECDIATPWMTDERAGWRGRCRPPRAAS